MRRIPISALLGLTVTGFFFLVALTAQWIAPFPMDEAAGGVWDPISATN
jgi:peptide/nickel transport system permease protein